MEERLVYLKVSEAIPDHDRVAFCAQVAGLAIVRQDSSHTTFAPAVSAEPIDDHAVGGIVDAFWDDEDGVAVSLILHFVDGYISWAERFRMDAQPVRLTVPDPTSIRFSWAKGLLP